MQLFNNDMIVSRGETFTLDRIVENKDKTPYIISKDLVNPYFLITVSNSKYEQMNRYIKNYWLDLSDFPRFSITQPVNLSSIKTSADSTIAKYEDFPDTLLEGYVDGKYVVYDDKYDAVFYKTNGDKTEYKFFNGTSWVTYNCRIIKTFSSSDTIEWVEQNYIYSIRLVSGTSTLSYLRSLCNDKNISFTDKDDAKSLVEKLSDVQDLQVDRPLCTFDTILPILNPCKLTVFSDI